MRDKGRVKYVAYVPIFTPTDGRLPGCPMWTERLSVESERHGQVRIRPKEAPCPNHLRVWKQDRPKVAAAASQAGHAKEESFTVSLANHPDYSQATMTKCSSVLQKQMVGDPKFLSDFTDFVKQVNF